MTIKEAQAQSGVSAENIRFYEKEGLLSPARDKGNDYRQYSPEDIRTLRRIRALRMLDMPLPEIRAVLAGSRSPGDAAAAQLERLEDRAERLHAAIDLCRELSSLSSLSQLDEDALLAQMDQPAHRGGFFRQWTDDYRRALRAEHEKRFTFLPDGPVTTPAEFSAALFAYAEENGLDLVITKEGMYPEFTLNGVPYTALRNYTAVCGCPVASVACEAMYPEDLDPPGVKPWRRRLYRIWCHVWCPLLVVFVLLMPRVYLFRSREGWAILFVFLVLVAILSFRHWLLFWSERHA